MTFITKKKTNLRILTDLKQLTLSILVVLCFFSVLAHPTIVFADNDLVVENVVVDYRFADSLKISAAIPDSAKFSNLSLILNAEGQQALQVKVEIGKNGFVETHYDLKNGGFIPFSRIYYWFEGELSNGGVINSPSYWFDYIDNRFTWKSNQSNLFTIFWVDGDAAYGQRLQQISRTGLENATRILPVAPEVPIEIYVYPDESSLQEVLSLSSKNWVNGHTFIGFNRLLVAKNASLTDLTDLERIIPHELMHLLEYQVTGENYNNTPAWLLEGLATQAELYPNPDQKRALNDALAKNTLAALPSLCNGFSQDANKSIIDYAHSSAIVEFIQKNYGSQVFLQLLNNSSSGLDCERNTITSLGISPQQLDNNWRKSLTTNTSAISSFAKSPLLWIAIPAIFILTGLIILLRRQRNQKKQQG